jgi:hypothetical protein
MVPEKGNGMRLATLFRAMRGHNGGAVKVATGSLFLALLIGACGGGGSGSAPSPSSTPAPTASPSTASPTPSPPPSEAAYGVLLNASTGATYRVSLVDAEGKVVSTGQASKPPALTCGNGANADLPPPVSTSNSRVYFLDAQGVVRFLSPGGDTGRATTVPVGGQRDSTFAVSPDDKQIAVVVSDFTSNGVATSLYVEDLVGGGRHKVIFTETGAFGLWPTGWHAGNLVVAKVPACAQGESPFCCGPQELHVVDPSTAARRFTLGGPTCIIAGPPSAAGAVCETSAQANVLDWSGKTTRAFSIADPTPAYLSPDGNQVALVKGNQSNSVDTTIEGSGTLFRGFEGCGWIDSTRILAGYLQNQAFVGDITTGRNVLVADGGTCAGRIPGGL